MKLPALLRASDPAGQIHAVQYAIEQAEAGIARQDAARQSALAAGEDIAAVRKIDRDLEEQRATIRAYGERLALLQSRRAAEERQQRRRAFDKQVDGFEASLRPRLQAIAAVEAAAKAMAAALVRLDEANGAVVYPVNNFYSGFRRDTLSEGVERRLFDCFEVFAAEWGRGAIDWDFARKAQHVAERIDGTAGAAAEWHTQMVSDLRNAGPLEPVAPEQEEAA